MWQSLLTPSLYILIYSYIRYVGPGRARGEITIMACIAPAHKPSTYSESLTGRSCQRSTVPGGRLPTGGLSLGFTAALPRLPAAPPLLGAASLVAETG